VTEHHAIEGLLLRLLIVLAALVFLSLLFGRIARRFGQPKEVGEILAGIALGPTLVGRVFPRAWEAVLTPDVKQSVSVLSQLGLVLLMILIGAEFPFRRVGGTIRGAAGVAIAGIAAPFGLTLAIAPLFVRALAIPPERAVVFSLLLATAVSITSIPIMGRILRALSLTETRVGLVSITAAAIDDVLGWTLLGAVVGVAQAGIDGGGVLIALAGAALLAAGAVLTGRWLAAHVPEERYTAGIPPTDLALVLGSALLLCAATNAIGIFSIFGGFLAGVAISFHRPLARALDAQLHAVVSVLFLPIFFMFSGLKTDLTGLGGSATTWSLLGALLLAAFAGKILPCAWIARRSGFPPREAWAVGILMNTRALMALVVINVGYDLKIFPKAVFVMLVTVAVVSTVITTPLLRRLVPRAEPL